MLLLGIVLCVVVAFPVKVSTCAVTATALVVVLVAESVALVGYYDAVEPDAFTRQRWHGVDTFGLRQR